LIFVTRESKITKISYQYINTSSPFLNDTISLLMISTWCTHQRSFKRWKSRTFRRWRQMFNSYLKSTRRKGIRVKSQNFFVNIVRISKNNVVHQRLALVLDIMFEKSYVLLPSLVLKTSLFPKCSHSDSQTNLIPFTGLNQTVKL
jgi:hypothetical protein